MTNTELYIMFNNFLNSIDLKFRGNRETFINCSIRKYNNFKLPLFKDLNEKKKGALVLRDIKEAGKYKAYTELFIKKKK